MSDRIDPDSPASVASILARMVREQLPEWTETHPKPGRWEWTDPDEDYERYVVVDGSDRERFPALVPEHDGKHLGPTVIGFQAGIAVRVDLPGVADSTDVRSALAAVDAIVDTALVP
jgi:hypothetical protein